MSTSLVKFSRLALLAGLLLIPTISRADDPETQPDGWMLIQVFSGEKDACSRNNVVSVPGRKGRIEVRRGETKWVVFESMKATFYWRCGDTEEKFSYGDVQPFNVVKVERSADTGRISWTCYMGFPNAQAGPSQNATRILPSPPLRFLSPSPFPMRMGRP